jgi:hypothetical protein
METMSDPGYINRKKELDESNWESDEKQYFK